MGEVCPKTTLYARCRNRAVALFTASLLASWTLCPAQAQPTLSPPVLSNDLVHAQLTLSNCANTTMLYTVQTSTDLVNWTNIQTNFAAFTNVLINVTTTNPQAFYQLVTTPAPIFQAAFVAVTNVTFKGNSDVIDSFDSSNPLYSTGGLYDATKRKANGNVYAGGSITNGLLLQNANIYGRVMTGPGTTQTNVQLGPNGSVGDQAWQAANASGIEPGFWSGGFNPTIPDVVAPSDLASLPAASNNIIYLNTVFVTAGTYFAASDPGVQIYIDGLVALWVAGSYSPNIVFNPNNPNASLTLFVGTTNLSDTNSLILGAHGSMNYPGNARNLQIYGLPGLSSVNFSGNATVVCTVYAPEAAVSGGGSGSTQQDTSGAIIANQINANGHWNFHYDESLARNGPIY